MLAAPHEPQLLRSFRTTIVMAKSIHDLVAFQRAVDTAVIVYEITKKFPREELYGLTSQLRRAAVSV